MQELPTKEWPNMEIRTHARYPRRMLVCAICKENGYTVNDVNTYRCKTCGNCMGCRKFGRQDLKNAKDRGKHTLISCSHCKALVTCATCKKGHEKEYWSKKELKNYISKGSDLICKECRHRGCTSRDPGLYTCTTCSGTFGSAKIDAKSFVNFKSHGKRTITCSNCMDARKARMKSLQSTLSKSLRKCTCFCPFHKALCPLTPCTYDEKRWPGSDGFISLEDKNFLESLQPKPPWWQAAWGRTKAPTKNSICQQNLQTT